MSWILNNVFLEDYYLYNKKNTLIDNLKKIDELYEHNNDTMYLELEKIERMKGLHIVIVDHDFNIVYDSMQKKQVHHQEQGSDSLSGIYRMHLSFLLKQRKNSLKKKE